MGKFVYAGLVLLLLASCLNKDEFATGQSTFPGQISAVQNGESWSAPMELILHTDSTDCPTFLLRSLDRSNYIWKSLYLGYLRPTWERQSVVEIIKYTKKIHSTNDMPDFSTSDYGDVPSSEYQVDTLSTIDFVQFAYYDTRQKRLFGAFQLSFDIVSKNSINEPNAPDRREFREGVFSVKLPPELAQCFIQ